MEYIIKIKKETKSLFKDKWVWKMAWKDARNNLSRLFLFVSSIVIGIAALVSIESFNINLQNNINDQAKDLMGADFVVKANSPFEDELIAKFDSLNIPQSSEANMASMAMFMTSTPGTRLVRVVAMEGGFPFYGAIETVPANAYHKVKESDTPYLILDENLASQYDVSADDSVKVGRVTFKVAGEVRKMPGGGGIRTTFTPSVYFNKRFLDSTGLVQYGSRVNYRRYFKTIDTGQADEYLGSLEPTIRKYGHSFDDVEEEKEELGESFQNLYKFFNLLAFVALILGCIGVASSVHIYVKEKRRTVAVLRCIGTSGWQAFNIFFIQTVIIGLIGTVLGIGLGLLIQFILPVLLEDFIPLELTLNIAWWSIAQGLLLGLIISILFSVLPLNSVRFVPPLSVLRTSMEPLIKVSKTKTLITIIIILFPFLFAAYQAQSWLTGLYFSLALFIAFLCLAGLAWSLMKLVKKFFPARWGFIWRQSLANLFRPNNQTLVLVVVIGLGAFLIATLSVVQDSLLNQVEFMGKENQSNTILFDIQPSQKEGVLELTKDNKLPVHQMVPIITCRIESLNGKRVTAIQNDTLDSIPNWAIRREYRVTYRDTLHASEELVSGKAQHISNDSVYITISKGLNENLNMKLGDSITFDVQGVPVKTYIGGVRDVEWPQDPPNFMIVFPEGVLEEAPQIYVMATRIDAQGKANNFQRELLALFPNVSLIDLRLILSTIDEFFSKVSFIIQFMALFSILTGLVVLAGAVINSRYLRLKENVLLRTIGAARKQIIGMALLEYIYLGFFAGLAGILLSILSGWVLAIYFFEVIFLPDLFTLSIIWIGVILLTVFIGWINTRGIINKSPLEVLRKEN